MFTLLQSQRNSISVNQPDLCHTQHLLQLSETHLHKHISIVAATADDSAHLVHFSLHLVYHIPNILHTRHSVGQLLVVPAVAADPARPVRTVEDGTAPGQLLCQVWQDGRETGRQTLGQVENCRLAGQTTGGGDRVTVHSFPHLSRSTSSPDRSWTSCQPTTP